MRSGLPRRLHAPIVEALPASDSFAVLVSLDPTDVEGLVRMGYLSAPTVDLRKLAVAVQQVVYDCCYSDPPLG